AHFLVMEFVDGLSLDRLVAKRGPLEPGYACYFIRQAAKGLAHAFQAGMVHRDIKPQNLMLTRKGQVKILDFGLARLASETRADLPAGLVAIVEKMMAQEPADRYQTPAEVVKALALYSKPAPVAVPLPVPAPPAAPAKKPTAPAPTVVPPVVETAPKDMQN